MKKEKIIENNLISEYEEAHLINHVKIQLSKAITENVMNFYGDVEKYIEKIEGDVYIKND